jgi:hypothetical protein
LSLLAPVATAGTITHPVVASTGVRDLLYGSVRRGIVLGSSAKAAWVDVGGECLVIEGPSGARLPNAIAAGTPLPQPPAGGFLRIGEGRVGSDTTDLEVVRWFDPKPRLGALSRRDLARHAAGLDRVAAGPLGAELERALTRRNRQEAIEVGSLLIGRGSGLTPAGDDVLAGALAAMVTLGDAIADRSAPGLVALVEPAVLELARARTTLLSATLLRHACAGRVAGPVGSLLVALAAGTRVEEELRSVERLGHSSGAALAAGTLIAVRALTGGWA